MKCDICEKEAILIIDTSFVEHTWEGYEYYRKRPVKYFCEDHKDEKGKTTNTVQVQANYNS